MYANNFIPIFYSIVSHFALVQPPQYSFQWWFLSFFFFFFFSSSDSKQLWHYERLQIENFSIEFWKSLESFSGILRVRASFFNKK